MWAAEALPELASGWPLALRLRRGQGERLREMLLNDLLLLIELSHVHEVSLSHKVVELDICIRGIRTHRGSGLQGLHLLVWDVADLAALQALRLHLFLLCERFLLHFGLLLVLIRPHFAEIQLRHKGVGPPVLLRCASVFQAPDPCLLTVLFRNRCHRLQICTFSLELSDGSIALLESFILGSQPLPQSFVLFAYLALLVETHLQFGQLFA